MIPASVKPRIHAHSNFLINHYSHQLKPYELYDSVWLLSRSVLRINNEGQESRAQPAEVTDELLIPQNIPTWAAFNSLLVKERPLTNVGALPLVPAPAHEWSTLLTVLKQAQHINTMIVGPERKTVITLDMQLYEKAMRLQMYRDDCREKWILRLGELHTVMAALRTVGAAIDGSGIDDAWVESGIYGPVTTGQILDVKHMKRSVDAHLTTIQALFDLYVQSNLTEEYQDEIESFKANCELLSESCKLLNSTEEIKTLFLKVKDTVSSSNILFDLSRFCADDEHKDNPMFKVTVRYISMVLHILMFIRASRQGLWDLHLASLDAMCKFFFVFDKLNYARMVPLYLAQMRELQTNDPEVWAEFQDGNFVVNKNAIPFCAIGPDHAIEHVNRWMKVSGGLVGITLNESARTRFFLIAPELARLAEEASRLAGVSSPLQVHHHDLSPAVLERQERNIQTLRETISSCQNPFLYDGQDLFNIVTKTVMPDEVLHDIINCDKLGLERYSEFVRERIVTSEVSIWSPMQKLKLKTWKSTKKNVQHNLENKVIELKEDRSLFARLLIVARSRPEINLQEAIGRYEFSSLPRSMFAVDGTLLPCTDKSNLMSALESLPNRENQCENEIHTDANVNECKVTIIDGMAVVQEIDKPHWIKTCEDFSNHFIIRLDQKAKGYDEVHLVFDRYDEEVSLSTFVCLQQAYIIWLK